MIKTILLATTMFGGAMSVAAQEDRFASVEIKAEALRGNLHVLYGAGGNIGVSAGESGVFIIDDQFAPLTDRIKAAIAEISDQPIRFVVNTHYHFDHTGGNENFGKDNSIIVAHDNVRLRLSKGAFIKAFNNTMDPQPEVALPVVTFNDEMSLHLNGEEARFIHAENAHTDGDSIIHFRGTNLFHMGDIFFNQSYPFIDVGNGGSIDGVIRAVKSVLKLADEETIVIPGHGPVTDKAGLKDYLDMLEGTRAIIAEMKADGKTVEEIRAAKPLSTYAEKWEGDRPEWMEQYIGFVFESLG
ncbi:MAG: MBL fold metallo-hydrolase [Kordiimonas sp.]